MTVHLSPYTERIVDNVIKGSAYNSGISYGFIKTKDGEEYFFHHGDIMLPEPRRGDRARFIVREPYNAKAPSPSARRGRANCVATLDGNGKPIEPFDILRASVSPICRCRELYG